MASDPNNLPPVPIPPPDAAATSAPASPASSEEKPKAKEKPPRDEAALEAEAERGRVRRIQERVAKRKKNAATREELAEVLADELRKLGVNVNSIGGGGAPNGEQPTGKGPCPEDPAAPSTPSSQGNNSTIGPRYPEGLTHAQVEAQMPLAIMIVGQLAERLKGTRYALPEAEAASTINGKEYRIKGCDALIEAVACVLAKVLGDGGFKTVWGQLFGVVAMMFGFTVANHLRELLVELFSPSDEQRPSLPPSVVGVPPKPLEVVA